MVSSNNRIYLPPIHNMLFKPISSTQHNNSKDNKNMELVRVTYSQVDNNHIQLPVSPISSTSSTHSSRQDSPSSLYEQQDKKYSNKSEPSNYYSSQPTPIRHHKQGPVSVHPYIPHINNTNINRYKCSQCSKSFSRPSSLRIHILSHTGEKPHECPHPGCNRRFSVQSNMRRHLKVHYCNP